MKKLLSIWFSFGMPFIISACTIFSGIDKNGQVWVGNNEDNSFSFSNQIHIHPATDSTFGFYTLSYQHHYNIEGGMNEAGLFFDFNALPRTIYKNSQHKTDFPGAQMGTEPRLVFPKPTRPSGIENDTGYQ